MTTYFTLRQLKRMARKHPQAFARIVTVAEAARLCDVSVEKASRWIDSGELYVFRMNGEIVTREYYVRAFMAQHAMPQAA